MSDARRQALDSIGVVTRQQQGLITRAQANRISVSDEAIADCIEDGALEFFFPDYELEAIEESHMEIPNEIEPGDIIRFSRHIVPDFVDIWAGYLKMRPDEFAFERLHKRGGPDAIISHETSGIIHGVSTLLGDQPVFTRLDPTVNLIEAPGVTILTPSTPVEREDYELMRTGLYSTTMLRTLADLIKANAEVSVLGEIAAGVRNESPERIEEMLGRFRGQFGLQSGVAILGRLAQEPGRQFGVRRHKPGFAAETEPLSL